VSNWCPNRFEGCSRNTVTLTGTAVIQAAVKPSALTFAKQAVNTTSNAKTVMLQNNLPTALTGISYSTTGPFGVSASTCATTLARYQTCTISVTFTPNATGTLNGTLSLSDSANNTPQAVTLTGTRS